MLYAILVRFFGNINLYHFLIFHHYLRKTGHVIGYGMLSLLLLRAWRATLGQVHAMLLRSFLLSWLGTLTVAALDEWHQSHIPSRGGKLSDVVLDTAAGVVFLFAAFRWLRRTTPEQT
jgi:VanZ family protein